MQTYRKSVVETLYRLITDGNSEFAGSNESTRQQLSLAIEESCYNESLQHCGLNEATHDMSPFRVRYHYHATNAMHHCDRESGLDMLNRIFRREISWKDTAKLNYRKLDPAPTAEEYDRYVTNRNELKIDGNVSEIYKCNKCGNPMVQKQVQMRGADESVSLILTCAPCSLTIHA